VESEDARAPVPRGGDPNVKRLRVSLTPDEWRQLRLMAAQDAITVEEVITGILRQELETKPRVAF
jgi:hypothetical protein